MLDATGKKLVRLLHPDQAAEVRAAAALVAGELGVRDAELGEALGRLADDPESAVRLRAMEAGGKLRVESLLPRLLPRIEAGGPESEVAAQAAARLGAKGLKAVQDVMAAAPPGLKRRLAGALAASGTASAENAALDALLDKDSGVVDAAARSLLAEVPSLTAAHRKALADHLLELLAGKKRPALAPASESALVRVLAALDDPRAEPVFWQRVTGNGSPELRAACVQALGPRPPADKDKLRQLLACAADRDFRVAAPALMLLKGVPVPDRSVKDWLPLFDAPDPAARRFAVEKLGDKDQPDLAAALLRQLGHRDKGLRDQALAALAKLKSGRAALADALLDAETPDEAWNLARAQAPFVREQAKGTWDKLFAAAGKHLEAGDRRADALLFLLREADAVRLRDAVEERAAALRKKKHYAAALAHLRALTRDPACAEAVRFEAAALTLKLSEKDLAGEARAADPSLQQFARLVHSHDVPPAERLRPTKWLDARDLFYLGFHFLEGDRGEREFGAEVLRLLQKRSPGTKLAKDARNKLRGAGMD
jgi:hypothetical protein